MANPNLGAYSDRSPAPSRRAAIFAKALKNAVALLALTAEAFLPARAQADVAPALLQQIIRAGKKGTLGDLQTLVQAPYNGIVRKPPFPFLDHNLYGIFADSVVVVAPATNGFWSEQECRALLQKVP